MNHDHLHVKANANSASSIDEYLEYRRIVGDDDGGQLFTPEQYAAYKRKVLPIRAGNRIFTSWVNSKGMDCKLIGPETLCFCNHRYKQHQTDFEIIPDERPIKMKCKVRGCVCYGYHYIPLNGSSPIRCICKHFSTDHSSKKPYTCNDEKCSRCTGFKSFFTCGCEENYIEHKMCFETKEERLARGHPIGQEVPYQAMGGLTGFSSLAEGYMRLDASGRGAANIDKSSSDCTSSDHPFERALMVKNYASHSKEATRIKKTDQYRK